MKKAIAYLPGDGVGPEVAAQAKKILQKVAELFDHEFVFTEGLVGGTAINAAGTALPGGTLELCRGADAILFGAIGDPKYDSDPSAKIRPEQGILGLRKELGLFANVRPIFTFKSLIDSSPLKSDIIEGADFVVIRELIGGIYFGKRGRSQDGTSAYDTSEYTVGEITQVVDYAFNLAKERQKKLTVVDKANVLETSRLWRETVQKFEAANSGVAVDYMFVDNASMQIIQNPKKFDVIVTENMFGDILTDEASVITGSLGMLPSASIGGKVSLFEPIHGSYPQAAGKNIANPIGSILSAAMLLEYSFGLKTESQAIFRAVEAVLEQGFGTEDLSAQTVLSTSGLCEKIIEAL